MQQLSNLFLAAKEADGEDELDGFLAESGLTEEDQHRLREMIRVNPTAPDDPPSDGPRLPVDRPSGIYQHYLSILRENRWKDEVVEAVDGSVRETAKRLLLRDPRNRVPSEPRPGYGMIIGRIQSGKTAHMIGLLLHAIDPDETERPYDTVIVMSGLINDLRLQTRKRVESAISSFSGQTPDIIPGAETDLSVADEDTLEELTSQLSDSSLTPIVVIKKNHIVLKHLLSCLPHASKTSFRRILIIDDEADHASVDTGGDDDLGKDSREESGEKKVDNPSETNRMLRQIIKRFATSRTCWYVGYTATPFANLLSTPGMGLPGDVNGPSLHPRDMLQVLDKPSEHLDNENYFLVPESRNVVEVSTSADDSVEEKRDFRNVVLRHILSQEIKKIRGIVGHHTTLIHTSIKVDHHKRVAKLIHHIVLNLQKLPESDSVLTDLRTLTEEYHLSQAEHGKLLERLEGLLNINFEDFVDLIDEIEVIEVNSREREPDEESPKDLIYGDAPRSYIAVGGTRLSRGLTLEGLTTSWFTRRANEPKYDTMLQQSRWCGFRTYEDEHGNRKDYSDLVRIMTTQQITRDFVLITNEEIDLRRNIGALPPDADPLEHEIWIREHPGMRITRPEAMEDAISLPWGNLVKSTIWSWDSPALGEQPGANAARIFSSTKKMLEKSLGFHGPLEEPPNGSKNFKLLRGVEGSWIRDFLEDYQELLEANCGTEKELRVLLADWNLNTWNIGIHTPDKGTTTKVGEMEIGLVNRSSNDGKIRNIQSSGQDTHIDIYPDQILREVPLFLIYLVNPSSTIKDEGVHRVFDTVVKKPVPIFGICRPTNLSEEGGWRFRRGDV